MGQIGAPLLGPYDYLLVGLSIFIAILASYFALGLVACVMGRAQPTLFEQVRPKGTPWEERDERAQ